MKNILMLGALLLVGCNAALPAPVVPPVTAKPNHLFEVEFERVGTQTPEARVQQVASGVSKQALNSVESGISFKKLSVQTFSVESQNKRYVQASFQVTNNTGRTLNDLTFIPVDTDDTDGDSSNNASQPTIRSTTFKNIYYFDRSDAAARAEDLTPVYPQIYRPALDQVEDDTTASPLRQELDLSPLNISAPAGLSVAGVRDYGWQINGAIPNGETGVVTFAVSYDMDADATKDPFGFTLLVSFADDPDQASITRIHTIQGSTGSGEAASPLNGQVVTIDGVVTADFQASNELNGFFVQEQADHADSDPTTSEGIFVYCNTTCADVSVGNRVQVTGTVTEFNTLTEITSVTGVVKLGSNTTLPAATPITLPVSSINDWERYEGMRLTVSGVVTDNYLLGRGGSVKLADARIPNYTQVNEPTASGYTSFLDDMKRRIITIDDGMMGQNPEPVKLARGGQTLSASNTLRGGDTGTVTGVLSYSYDGWNGSTDSYRIHATNSTFTGPARPTAPGNLGGTLKVASMNVLNYFNGNGAGGGFPTSRGAESISEYNKQKAKIVEALVGLDADVIGLLEIENDYSSANPAIQELVNAVNSHPGVNGTYTYVNPVSKVGTDEISVGMIYRNTVTPVGQFAVLDSSFNPLYVDTKNRPTWARSFQDNTTGGIFTVVQAHLKSKGSECGAGDDDTTTGQGNCNKTRTDAATVLMDWLAGQPTGVSDNDVILMGDLNAYMKEDPIQAILKGSDDTAATGDDFQSLFDQNSYSYQFGSQWGSLDHGIASGSLAAQVSGAEKWHINSDEPTVLDYNENFKTPTQITTFYAADAYRSSDHDPLKVGLNLNADVAPAASFDLRTSSSNVDVTVGNSGTVYVGVLGSNYAAPVMLSASVSGGTGITVSYPSDPIISGEASEAVQIDVPAGTPDGTYTVTLTGMGIPAGTSDTATFTITVSGNTPVGPTPWINEIHYDNSGGDVGEFIEVIVPSGYSATGLKVELYNGGNLSMYDSDPLVLVGTHNGYSIYRVDYPADGIQNGGSDGMALCSGTTLIQFLSYEGTLTPTSGCASGVTSTDIGVAEISTTLTGSSLQLTGTGNKYSDFTWTGPTASTTGAVNTGQTLN
ncbi:ExeM/NucH family extracellular endonuclease [Deinococcus cellulosilyticus]|nr:ExeM/NucH family extracellular endonuclease [Deinococcus cellulosilyticus]